MTFSSLLKFKSRRAVIQILEVVAFILLNFLFSLSVDMWVIYALPIYVLGLSAIYVSLDMKLMVQFQVPRKRWFLGNCWQVLFVSLVLAGVGGWLATFVPPNIFEFYNFSVIRLFWQILMAGSIGMMGSYLYFGLPKWLFIVVISTFFIMHIVESWFYLPVVPFNIFTLILSIEELSGLTVLAVLGVSVGIAKICSLRSVRV